MRGTAQRFDSHGPPPPCAPPPASPVAVSRVQARFNAFIRSFKDNGADVDCKYMQLLQEVGARGRG